VKKKERKLNFHAIHPRSVPMLSSFYEHELRYTRCIVSHVIEKEVFII